MIGNSGGASGSGHSPFDSRVASDLLDKLATDDDFRDQFSSNPVGALAQIGYPAASGALSKNASMGFAAAQPGEDAFSCMRVNSLASKEEFAAAREELHAHLTSSGNHTVVFAFESNNITAALRRK
ncbi:NHLP-related RiPP peptide [Lysobacter panacisoli]|uniref:NHLP-related RiPP peptide n=1 Tax=Lysobacter panacisoli TaxID=1255263 RepID=A0ABP9KVL9_9GAMM|nr:NHLP-related RiPP peptide [Lysobacter panacisoli]